jgi:hypothetical protein
LCKKPKAPSKPKGSTQSSARDTQAQIERNQFKSKEKGEQEKWERKTTSVILSAVT